MCKPNNDGNGWLYSAALVDLVRQYRAAFPSLFAALDPSSGGAGAMGEGGDGERQKLRASDLFPHAPPEQHDSLLKEVRRRKGGLAGGRLCVSDTVPGAAQYRRSTVRACPALWARCSLVTAS